MNSQNLIDKILSNVEKVIIGKRDVTRNILKGMMAGGHILIEDIPGVGKTTLVKALAKTLDLSYSRIQFTPDLLPSDITGISIYNQKDMKFEFKKGPVFSNIVLADEINRTSPRTQSALLEVMEESQISEGTNTYILDKPFFVLATQNPIEYEGTYTLPEAQLDRFIMKISMGYPDRFSEEKILEVYSKSQPMEEISAVASGEDIKNLQTAVRSVNVHKEINSYIVNIAEATRKAEFLNIGISTRAALALLKIAQAEAVINGRDYVIPEDVKNNVVVVLSHRLSVSSEGRARDYSNENILEEILKNVEVPRI